VLIVDGDPRASGLLARILGREGYRCELAQDAEEARARLRGAPFDVLLCDVLLPDGSGLDLVAMALRLQESMAALMVSGLDDAALAERAVRRGAYGYVVKPFSPSDVLIGVSGALRHRQAALDARGELKATQEEIIQRLCATMEARDAGAAAHMSQMSGYCWRVGCELELGPEACELLRLASQMHDVGNVAVPDRVLLKAGTLTAGERARMERHAETGYRILAGSRTPLLRMASTIAWSHHERLDGSGYPRGLSGDGIPLEGRIAAVADVFVAATHDRVYRPRLARPAALALMKSARKVAFDPDVLDAFLAVEERLTAERRGPEVVPQRPMTRTPVDPELRRDLSAREREVLQLAADGKSPVEIAQELVVSPGTVKTHFHRIYGKLDARDRAAAVAAGMRRGLID
jgi:putative two-component system response regulator